MLLAFGVGFANFGMGREQLPREIARKIGERLPLLAWYGATGERGGIGTATEHALAPRPKGQAARARYRGGHPVCQSAWLLRRLAKEPSEKRCLGHPSMGNVAQTGAASSLPRPITGQLRTHVRRRVSAFLVRRLSTVATESVTLRCQELPRSSAASCAADMAASFSAVAESRRALAWARSGSFRTEYVFESLLVAQARVSLRSGSSSSENGWWVAMREARLSSSRSQLNSLPTAASHVLASWANWSKRRLLMTPSPLSRYASTRSWLSAAADSAQ